MHSDELMLQASTYPGMQVHTQTHPFLYKYTHTQIHMHILLYTHKTQTPSHIHTLTLSSHTSTPRCTHMHIHTGSHTNTPTHTQTYLPLCKYTEIPTYVDTHTHIDLCLHTWFSISLSQTYTRFTLPQSYACNTPMHGHTCAH